MQVIPAVDMREGRCVRLFQGRADRQTIYYEDPGEAAQKWEDLGAERLHLVDLDGAFKGVPGNLEAIKRIASRLQIPTQLGGGIRDQATVEKLFGLGITRVILGTAALENPSLVAKLVEKYGDRVMVGVDARDGKVAVKGWVETAGREALDLVKDMEKAGVQEIVYTDISRDGTLEGPNLEATEKVARETGVKVIASGGVSSLGDIRRARELGPAGITGIIVGQALYAGKFTLGEALAAARA